MRPVTNPDGFSRNFENGQHQIRTKLRKFLKRPGPPLRTEILKLPVHITNPLQMLIIKSLILALSVLTQVAVLAAPIPLDARALSSNNDQLFSRAEGAGSSQGDH